MSHPSLSAAADERKSRLLQLKNLKRKAPPSFDDDASASNDLPPPTSPPPLQSPPSSSSTITTITQHLSGRNYDPTTKGPILGFEKPPTENLTQPTLEESAHAIEAEVRSTRAKEAEGEEGEATGLVVLRQLRPRKPNWDLRRDLERKMAVLGARTEAAIARVVRERVEGARRAGEEGEEMEGVRLVESVRQLERGDGVGGGGEDEDVDGDE